MKNLTLRTIWPVLLAVLFASTAAAAVSVDEVIRLHSRGLSTDALLLVVQTSETPDTISTQQLDALLDAGVADTVITTLIAQADAVAEDWEPVDVDEAVDNYRIVKQTEYVYVDDDPDWNVSFGFGWGSPYYYSYWYRPLYAGWGWDPFWDPWYWGWCATPYYYYDPWYYHPSYYVSIGWYWGGGWWDHHHNHHYWYDDHYWYDHDGDYRFSRLADRPSYRNGVDRHSVYADDGKSYRGTTDRTSVDGIRSLDRDRTLTDKTTRTGDRTIASKDTRVRDEVKLDDHKVDAAPAVTTPRKATNRYDKSTDRTVRSEVKSEEKSRGDIFDRSTRTETREEKLERFKNIKPAEKRIYSRDRVTTEPQAGAANRERISSDRRATTGTKEGTRSTVTRRTTRATEPARTRTETPKAKAKEPAKKDSNRSVAPQSRSDRPSGSRSVERSTPSRSAPKASPSRGSSNSGKSSGRSSGGSKGRTPR